MTKYKAVLEYDGTSYHGWQLQIGVPTIQGALERTLSLITGGPVRVHGAGRTDAGVHARGQVCHFQSEWKHSSAALGRACNALLPSDIAVKSIEGVSQDFHARHCALSKTYVYTIFNRPLRSPLTRLYYWHVYQPLNVSLMREAAGMLSGKHDFAAFGTATDGTPSTVREVFDAAWSEYPPIGMITFTIRGSGFLRYMVRSLVGTMVWVGRERISPLDFSFILNSCDRSKATATAPPHGLVLDRVEY